MPAFNSSRFIATAINSVIQQKFNEWELLVIDGGSSDNTRDLVSRFATVDNRISLVLNSDDKGPAHARSIGIRKAQGDFIAFLDADDIWLPTKLLVQIKFMCSNNSEFSYTKYRVMNMHGTEASCEVSVHSKYTYHSYFFLRGIACSTVVVKHSLFSENILNTYGLWHGEDTLWWLKLFQAGAVGNCIPGKSLVLYRDSIGSLSKYRLCNQTSVWRIYRNDFSLSILIAITAYVCYITDVTIRQLRYRLCTKYFGKKKVEALIV